MTEAILDIKAWGNNLGVRLPAAVARAARLKVDQRMPVLSPAAFHAAQSPSSACR